MTESAGTERIGSAVDIEVGVGVLIRESDQGWQVLISRRRAGAVLGGSWELPGGKVEPGEEVTACIIREMDEELGVEVLVGHPIRPVEHTYDHGRVRLTAHFCRLVSGVPKNIGVSEHKWLDYKELMGVKFPPANRVLTDQVVEILGSGASRESLGLGGS